METSKRGISLIVLAITIIVMIILATAIILSVSGNNVMDSAKEAANASDVANAKHAVAVAKGEWELGEVEGYTTFKAYAEAKLKEAGFRTTGNGGINVLEAGAVTTIYVDNAGKQVLIPEGYVASSVETEDDVSEGLVIYQGTEPVTDKNVREAKTTRNQFVWIPVENFGRDYHPEENIGHENSELVSQSVYNELTSYNEKIIDEEIEHMKMKESVNKYGGFYIARYEAGTSVQRDNAEAGVELPLTEVFFQKNRYVYSRIDWTDAKSLCTSLGTDAAVGHLIYAEEWEAALAFIETNYPGYRVNSIFSDGKDRGNYEEARIDTGTDDKYSVNNIYDMAGNLFEWTMECRLTTNSGTLRIARGGSDDGGDVDRTGATFPAGCRIALPENEAGNNNVGFRAAMYLK